MPMTLQNLRLLPQHWHQNLQWWLWYGLMAVLPYTIVQSTRFTGIFTIGLISNAVLFLQGWQHLPLRLKQAKPVLLGLGLYLVQVLFTPFSQNIEEGTHLLSVRLGMVWIPLVLFLLPPPAHVVRTMVWVLALSVFSVLLISQREGLIWLQDCPPCYLDELCPLPKPYIPLFTLGAAALLAQWGGLAHAKWHKVAALILALSGTLFYAKMGVIAFLVAAGVGVLAIRLHTTKNNLGKSQWWFWSPLTMLVMVTIGLSLLFHNWSVPQLGNGAAQLTGVWWIDVSISARTIIWHCVSEAVYEGHAWLIGTGTGGFGPVLFPKYCALSLDACTQLYNPHNQYMEQWLAAGLLGLLALPAVLAKLFQVAMRQQRWAALAFTTALSFLLMTECFLTREVGVLCSVICVCILYMPVKTSYQAK